MWDEKKISDFSVLVTKGTTPTSIGCGFEESGINYIKSESIGQGRRLDRSKYAFISDETHEKLKRSQIQEGDILFSMAGAYLGKTGIVTSEDVPANTNQAVAIIRLDSRKVNPEFVYYVLNQSSMIARVNSSSSQSAQPNINLKDIGNLSFLCPERMVQDKIVSLLSNIDSKIENNEKLNRNLECQAQTIFKEWFIDNMEKDTWETGTFSDLIVTTIGGDWGKAEESGNFTEQVYCMRGADIPEVNSGNKGKMPTRFILPKNLATKRLTAGDVVVEISGGSPTQSTGRIASISQSLLDRYEKEMVCTNFCRALKPKEGFSMFVYYYWQYMYDRNVFFSYENGTTGIKNLDIKGFLSNEEIVLPPIELIKDFDDFCHSIFDEIFKNGLTTERLSETRDVLLPRLMSGELDVSDLDI